MGVEIERKFLVKQGSWPRDPEAQHVRQGYLSLDPARSVRVRVAGGRGKLTVKGESRGAARSEYEYTIPEADAKQMLERQALRPVVEKIRHRIPHAGLIWEVDEFLAENQGMVLAEVELVREDQAVELPGWVEREVTGDPRYFNVYLCRHPFNSWRRDQSGGILHQPHPQAGTIPWRRTGKGVELLLITTRRQRRWTIPKGGVEEGEDARTAAMRESWEEAGIRGESSVELIGSYHYAKEGRLCHVEVFPMEVTELANQWPEVDCRSRQWLKPAEVLPLLEDRELRDLFARIGPFLKGAMG